VLTVPRHVAQLALQGTASPLILMYPLGTDAKQVPFKNTKPLLHDKQRIPSVEQFRQFINKPLHELHMKFKAKFE